jgi:hypothetical protein
MDSSDGGDNESKAGGPGKRENAVNNIVAVMGIVREPYNQLWHNINE